MSDRGAERLWTPANIVTITRIVLVPVFVVTLLSPWPAWFPEIGWLKVAQPWVATLIFIILAATDSLDGYLARSRNEVTTFGKFMDPLADKLLVCSALIALVELRILPSWVVIIIIARDFMMSGIRLVAASKGEVIAASWYGKFKTVFQMIAIVMFLIKGSLSYLFGAQFGTVFYILSWIIMGIALVLTIVSLADYFYHARFLLGFATAPVGSAADDEGMVQPETAIADNRDGVGDGSETGPDLPEPGEMVETLSKQCANRAQEVIERALAAGKRVSTCESLTGGLIGAYLTSVSGSSAVVRGGLITYAEDTKSALAGVSAERLAQTGPVDGEVARQMAEGSRAACESDIAVAVTGIAGPTGAEPGKPVGTVWFGVSTAQESVSERCRFCGNRQEVRLHTVLHALELILERLPESAR